MARSLASPLLAPPAAAAWSWIALAAALLAIPVARPAPRPTFHMIAAHEPAAASVWEGADRVYDELDRRIRGVAAPERAALARLIVEEAARAELAPLLVLAVIGVESGFDTRAVSPVGAVGLMQLMPPTLRQELALASLAAKDPFEPAANIRAGVRYLGKLVATFPDVEHALMAYNAGPARIRRHLGAGGVPARFNSYPRNVLREVARLGPTRRTPNARAGSRRPLAAAHAKTSAPKVVEPMALHRRAPGPTPLHAGLELVAPCAGAIPERRACVRLEPALPMSRGRDRPRPLERALPG